jgi:hypothetical protein
MPRYMCQLATDSSGQDHAGTHYNVTLLLTSANLFFDVPAEKP